MLAKFQNVHFEVARESYRLAKPAFTTDGIASAKEIDEFLKADAELFETKRTSRRGEDFCLRRNVE